MGQSGTYVPLQILSSQIPAEEFNIDGYDTVTNINEHNINKIRGCIMYIRKGINYKQITLENKIDNFDENISIEVNLQNNDKLLCTTIYRRGESSPENNDSLLKFLDHVSNNLRYSHQVIIGDFNLKDIEWGDMVSLKNDPHDINKKFLESGLVFWTSKTCFSRASGKNWDKPVFPTFGRFLPSKTVFWTIFTVQNYILKSFD